MNRRQKLQNAHAVYYDEERRFRTYSKRLGLVFLRTIDIKRSASGG